MRPRATTSPIGAMSLRPVFESIRFARCFPGRRERDKRASSFDHVEPRTANSVIIEAQDASAPGPSVRRKEEAAGYVEPTCQSARVAEQRFNDHDAVGPSDALPEIATSSSEFERR
jgi:hypothetical protein